MTKYFSVDKYHSTEIIADSLEEAIESAKYSGGDLFVEYENGERDCVWVNPDLEID